MTEGLAADWSPEQRDFAVRWLAVTVLVMAAAAGLRHYGVRLDRGSTVAAVRGIVLLAALAAIYSWAALRIPALKRAAKIANDFLMSLVQLAVLLRAVLPITYLAARIGADVPLADAALVRIDALFGFDWDRMAAAVAANPMLQHDLSLAYRSVPVQVLALLVIGSICRTGSRNSDLIWLALVSMSLTAVVATMIEAVGKTGQLGPHYRAVVEMIRAGRWTYFSYDDADGIVTFPSYHTTVAVLLTYVAGHLDRKLLIIFLPLNLLMLASVFPIGGHYLTDAIGGAAVAAVTIIAVRWGQADRAPALRPAAV